VILSRRGLDVARQMVAALRAEVQVRIPIGPRQPPKRRKGRARQRQPS
jgi:hypothetical protein